MADLPTDKLRLIVWPIPGKHEIILLPASDRSDEPTRWPRAIRAALSHVTFHGSGLHYYHDRWEEQKETGGKYYVIVSDSEVEEHVQRARQRQEQRRQSERSALADYEKPEPLPFSALPSHIQDKIKIDQHGCWLWQGQTNSEGYGLVSNGQRKGTGAHRVVYERLCGPIPEPLQLRHSCHVPPCVNPHHLTPGTAQQNNDDKVARKRRRK